MASARVFFSRRRQQQRNGYINEEVPVVENGYEPQDSDEDEVFVQDPNLEISATKPLMHPRNKTQQQQQQQLRAAKVRTRTLECRICSLCKPILYFAALVTVLCSVMATIVYIANRHRGHSHNKDFLKDDGGVAGGQGVKDDELASAVLLGCDSLEVEDVWTVGFPKLLTESAFRLVDVNGDGIDDVIFGFATGADGYGVNEIVCDLYFQGQRPCLGGVMALDGKTGQERWRHYTHHEVYALNCQYDVDKDGTSDCLAAGRAGVLLCVSGKDGALIWTIDHDTAAILSLMNFYTPQYVGDLDGDQVGDVVVTHGGDPTQEANSETRMAGRLLIISGKSGVVLRWAEVPDRHESYYSPQVLTRFGDIKVLLFGTGGESHNGSLWRLELNSLIKGLADRAVKISSDSHKGFMTPPALVDLTGDGIEDILVPSFNSTLLAVNGDTFQPLWSVRFESSESYSTPAMGYYNQDDVPDALVKYASGPGFPLYYYSQTTIIDGKTGAMLIDPPLKDTIGSQSSGLTVAMEGTGNDVFLVWMADCQGHEGATSKFSFQKGTPTNQKSRSDLCRQRFQSKGVSRLVALSRHLPAGGALVYNSEARKTLEHNKWVNTSKEAYDYIIQHPDILDKYHSQSLASSEEEEDGLRPSPDAEAEAEEFYGQQRQQTYYPGMHRTSSKKGPSLTASSSSSSSNGRYHQEAHHSRGGNRGLERNRRPGGGGGGGGGGSSLPSHYLQQQQQQQNKNSYQHHQQPSDLSRMYPQNSRDDEYGFPYNRDDDVGSNGYYGRQYGGQYFSNSGRGRDDQEEDNIGYQDDGYPYSYRSYPERRRRRRGATATRGREKKRRRREIAAADVFDALRSGSRIFRERGGRRLVKRHVGPHDDDGIQRLVSTGTLAPTLLPSDDVEHNRTIDLIFATYWNYPSNATAILEIDQKCILENLGKEMSARFDVDSAYYQLDHDQYEKAVTDDCLQASGHSPDKDETYQAADGEKNPFIMNMGQMTIYRLRLKFTCSQEPNATETGSPRCARVLPFAKQRWAAYMGTNGDSHWSTPPH